VQENFRRYDLLDPQRVHFIKGFFSDTIPTAPLHEIAVLRMDGDMFESTAVVLKHLYPKLSTGGWVIIDDFCLKTCRLAVMEYREKFGITAPMYRGDWCGVYWQKTDIHG
jgi:hypothetical protein